MLREWLGYLVPALLVGGLMVFLWSFESRLCECIPQAGYRAWAVGLLTATVVFALFLVWNPRVFV